MAPRHELYRVYSDRLMAILRDASPVVETLSIDEAWLNWSAHGFVESSVQALRERCEIEYFEKLAHGTARRAQDDEILGHLMGVL